MWARVTNLRTVCLANLRRRFVGTGLSAQAVADELHDRSGRLLLQARSQSISNTPALLACLLAGWLAWMCVCFGGLLYVPIVWLLCMCVLHQCYVSVRSLCLIQLFHFCGCGRGCGRLLADCSRRVAATGAEGCADVLPDCIGRLRAGRRRRGTNHGSHSHSPCPAAAASVWASDCVVVCFVVLVRVSLCGPVARSCAALLSATELEQ